MSGEPGATPHEVSPDESSEPGDPVADVPDKVIAAALEFAVGIAAAGAKLKAPLASPPSMRPFLKFQKLPANALPKVRAAVEADPGFRRRLSVAAQAAPELLDPPSLLWLTRSDGWVAQLRATVGSLDSGDLAAELRRAERRREAAEQAAHRVVAEVTALRLELERRADVSTTSAGELDRLRADLATARTEVERHQAALAKAREQTRAANERSEQLVVERDAALARAADAERVRDDVLASRAAGAGAEVERATDAAVLAGAAAVADELEARAHEVTRLAAELDRLARRLHHLEPARALASVPERPRTRARTRGRGSGQGSGRTPIAVPGGLYGDSLAAAEHVVRHPHAVVMVDGYNVAKLRFPTLDLAGQRERTIDLCEDVARRWGTNLVLVFDGTNGVGIAGTARRLVRVTYSPEGVIADDTIRAEVAALPDDVPVVVVTNDQAVITDVRAMGANPVSSDRFLELATR
ncbi:MAG: NYN domain-containing protein [Acidimicrobiales bacterium]